MPWNPNRLEQREGRIDRYGQAAPVVKTYLLYGSDNKIDLAVLEVLIRKAVAIHKLWGSMSQFRSIVPQSRRRFLSPYSSIQVALNN
ncbi:MAG: hypothetical protein LH474_04535 [Chamaesiphon sp.]|nr:hypothetical protein [Chamaesiphon sp.]